MVFFTLWFYNFIEKIGKKKKVTPVEGRYRRKTKQCYHNDICRWKKDSVPTEVETTRGIV